MLAAAALASLAVPAQAEASRGGYTVTVQAPGPGAPAGEIASGTVNGQGWQIVEERHCPNLGGSGRGGGCVTFTGAALDGAAVNDPDTLPMAWTAVPSGTSAPVALLPVLLNYTQIQYGPVKADVAVVRIRFTNGAVLTLHPVNVYGTRGIGFAAPAGATIVSATAYKPGGSQIGTAVPFGQPDQPSMFATWLKPGQHGRPRADGAIGSGQGWAAHGYVGPYGLCFVSAGEYAGESCIVTAPRRGAFVAFTVSGEISAVYMGVTAKGVVRLVATLPGGKTRQVRLVTVGGQKFFSLMTDTNFTLTAYYANGTSVAGTS